MAQTVFKNTTQLASLFDEFAAMIRSQRPLLPGLRTLEDRRLGRLAVAAGQLRKSLERGSDLETALVAVDRRFGRQAAAAFRLAQQTGSAEPLETLARLLREGRDRTAARRASMIYPAGVALTGYLFIACVMTRIIMAWGAGSPFAGLIPLASWLRSFWWLPLLGMVAAALGLSFARWRRPGSRYGAWSVFCRAMAAQIQYGLPLTGAYRLAADLSCDAALRSDADDWQAAAEEGRPPQALGSLPPLLQQTLRDLHRTHSGLDPEILHHQFDRLALWYATREEQQHAMWVRWIPSFTVALVGLICVGIYGYLVLLPIASELSKI